ncbi:MAG: malonyl-CoA decarboxylase [Zoogloeaceae bacterium]|jgi:malonyl-CoA decarboxylase|nr:malonyl-CoA decarboxylase [Zoogloeaceae bacterium]
MAEGLMHRGIKKVRDLWKRPAKLKALDSRGLARVREQLADCASGLGGEVSARQRAKRLGETYLALDDDGKHAFLRLIATEFGPDPQKIATAHTAYQAALGTPEQWEMEARLWRALRSPRSFILSQFTALPQGIRFLIDLRVDLMRFLKADPELFSLDRELEYRLSNWFDVSLLELQRITWQSPAALLEKLIQYEAVHTIHSWQDLKNRLDADRRCYGFFHPKMPDEPLIFVEVALTDHLADNVQALLDVHAPVFDSQEADTAIFYSISNTQTGLRGVSFGHFLLKRVIDDLQRDFPALKRFSTLSPIPALRRWAMEHPDAWRTAFLPGDLERLARCEDCTPSIDLAQQLLDDPTWPDNPRLARAFEAPLSRLAAHYLSSARAKNGRLYDPVARFHLGNGARIERLNYLGDTSAHGLAQSWGMMVNYLYEPEAIERNVEALLRDGKIAMSSAVRLLAKNVNG